MTIQRKVIEEVEGQFAVPAEGITAEFLRDVVKELDKAAVVNNVCADPDFSG